MRVISNYISIAPLIPTYQVVIPISKQSMEAMSPELPPGFRFHPTDEELIVYYLRNQAASRPSPASMIPEINIYSFDPWELPGKSDMCEGEWYFFSPRHRKYPNGARPNRATSSGYWKATGTDKAIHSGSRYVGVKKALVFYRGRPPKGAKTEWIMHEYRLGEHTSEPKRPNGSLGVLDEWVLCRIYKKRQQKRGMDDSRVSSPAQEQEPSVADFEEEEEKKNIPAMPRLFSLAHLLDSDYISASQIFDDHPLGTIDDLFDSSDGAIKLTGAQSSIFNIPPVFVDPIFQH